MSEICDSEVGDIEDYDGFKRVSSPTIRILQLSKSDFHLGDKNVLQGSLKEASLNSWTQFDAVSYACGSPDSPSYILINGRKIAMTSNCEDSLRFLRDNFGLRTVWVDSICINSADKVEKGGQLPLMTHIYGRARYVYLWFGERSPGGSSDRALDWLEQASENQHPFVGARLGTFPENMSPWRIVRTFWLMVEHYRDSKSLVLSAGTMLTPLIQRFAKQFGGGLCVSTTTLQSAISFLGPGLVAYGLSRRLPWLRSRLWCVVQERSDGIAYSGA